MVTPPSSAAVAALLALSSFLPTVRVLVHEPRGSIERFRSRSFTAWVPSPHAPPSGDAAASSHAPSSHAPVRFRRRPGLAVFRSGVGIGGGRPFPSTALGALGDSSYLESIANEEDDEKQQAGGGPRAAWAPPGRGGNQRTKITSILQPQDLLDFVIEDNRLSVVKVFASWCKTCQAFDLRYRKLASQMGDKYDGPTGTQLVERGRVRFGEMQYDDPNNEEMCKLLNATKLPYILIYKGSRGKVTDFQCGPANFQRVIDAVNEFSDPILEELPTAEGLPSRQPQPAVAASGRDPVSGTVTTVLLNQKDKEIARLRDDLAALRKTSELTVQGMRDQNARATKQVLDEMERQKVDFQEERSSMEARMQKLEKAAPGVEEKIKSEDEAKSAQLRDEIERMKKANEEERSKLTDRVRGLDGKLTERESELQSNKEASDSFREEMSELMNELKEERATLSDRVEGLEDDITRSNKKLMSGEKTVNEARRELKQRIKELEEDRSSLAGQVKDVEGTLAEKDQKIQYSVKTMEDLKTDMQKQKEEFETERSRLADRIQELENSEREALPIDARDLRDTMDQQRRKYEVETSSLRKSVNGLEEAVSARDKLIGTVQNATDILLGDMESQKLDHEQELGQTAGLVKDLERDISKRETQMTLLEEKVASLDRMTMELKVRDKAREAAALAFADEVSEAEESARNEASRYRREAEDAKRAEKGPIGSLFGNMFGGTKSTESDTGFPPPEDPSSFGPGASDDVWGGAGDPYAGGGGGGSSPAAAAFTQRLSESPIVPPGTFGYAPPPPPPLGRVPADARPPSPAPDFDPSADSQSFDESVRPLSEDEKRISARKAYESFQNRLASGKISKNSLVQEKFINNEGISPGTQNEGRTGGDVWEGSGAGAGAGASAGRQFEQARQSENIWEGAPAGSPRSRGESSQSPSPALQDGRSKPVDRKRVDRKRADSVWAGAGSAAPPSGFMQSTPVTPVVPPSPAVAAFEQRLAENPIVPPGAFGFAPPPPPLAPTPATAPATARVRRNQPPEPENQDYQSTRGTNAQENVWDGAGDVAASSYQSAYENAAPPSPAAAAFEERLAENPIVPYGAFGVFPPARAPRTPPKRPFTANENNRPETPQVAQAPPKKPLTTEEKKRLAEDSYKMFQKRIAEGRDPNRKLRGAPQPNDGVKPDGRMPQKGVVMDRVAKLKAKHEAMAGVKSDGRMRQKGEEVRTNRTAKAKAEQGANAKRTDRLKKEAREVLRMNKEEKDIRLRKEREKAGRLEATEKAFAEEEVARMKAENDSRANKEVTRLAASLKQKQDNAIKRTEQEDTTRLKAEEKARANKEEAVARLKKGKEAEAGAKAKAVPAAKVRNEREKAGQLKAKGEALIKEEKQVQRKTEKGKQAKPDESDEAWRKTVEDVSRVAEEEVARLNTEKDILPKKNEEQRLMPVKKNSRVKTGTNQVSEDLKEQAPSNKSILGSDAGSSREKQRRNRSAVKPKRKGSSY